MTDNGKLTLYYAGPRSGNGRAPIVTANESVARSYANQLGFVVWSRDFASDPESVRGLV